MKKNQKGIAMVIVICIMAVLVMMSMALLLASSVMISNAQKTKAQAQSRILAVTLADELERELTLTESQVQAMPQSELDNSIWGYVNRGITGNAWAGYEEGSGEEEAAKKSFTLAVTDSELAELLEEDGCQVEMYWERGSEEGFGDATLTVKVTCALKQAVCSVTTVYAAREVTGEGDGAPEDTDGEAAAEGRQVSLFWIRSERRQG